MQFPSSLFREYDVRGNSSNELSESLFEHIGATFPNFLKETTPSICVGWDARKSSPAFSKALIRGLRSRGVHVKELGLAPTPLVYWAEHHLKTNGALIVTGSHTPPHMNGLKFTRYKKPFYGQQLKALHAQLAYSPTQIPNQGTVVRYTLYDDYIKDLVRRLAWPTITLSVVWDFGYGATAALASTIQRHIPGQHTFLRYKADDKEPPSFDPTAAQALTQLQQTVTKEKHDLGIAFDGDGDRMVVVDAQGNVWQGDEVLTLFATFITPELHKNTLVADIKTSPLLLQQVAGTYNTQISKTGHVHIKDALAQSQGTIGGEVSGHFFFNDCYFGFDDGLFAALRLLHILGTYPDLTLHTWRKNLPKRFSTPEIRVQCDPQKAKRFLDNVKRNLTAQATPYSDLDGILVTTQTGWWLIRPSNTEAVLSLRWEASTQQQYTETCLYLKNALSKYEISIDFK